MQKLLLAVLAASLAFQPPVSAQTSPPDGTQHLATGIRQVEGGDWEAAVITLEAAVQRLGQEKGRENDLATAHLYLAVSHLGMHQWERAKSEMREAWRNNRQLTLDPRRFSPRAIQLYEEARPRPAASAAKATPPKKGNRKGILLDVGVGIAAVGSGVALWFGEDAKGKDELLLGVRTADDASRCVPSLLFPPAGATVDNGCTGPGGGPDPSEPQILDFAWSACTGATHYHLYVKHQLAANPMIDNPSLTGTTYHSAEASYTRHLFGWTWRVRAFVGGVWGPWSPELPFYVEPPDTDCPK